MNYEEIYNIIINNPLYKAIAFVFLSILVAKISDIVFTSLLRRMASRTKTSIDDHIIDILHKPIYYTILFIGLGFSISLVESLASMQFFISGIIFGEDSNYSIQFLRI